MNLRISHGQAIRSVFGCSRVTHRIRRSSLRDNGRMPTLDRIYTKTGDDGMTGLGGGQRVPKDSRRVETYGTVDELNSQIGVALATGLCERLTTELTLIQNELFDLGSDLATPATSQARHPVPTVEPRHVEKLERLIDEFNEIVGPLTNFLLPGGSPGAAQLHVARTVCRRAEREAADPRSRRGHRPDRPPLPQPPVRRAVRDGALREPPTRTSPNRSGGLGPDVAADRRSRTGSSEPGAGRREARRRTTPVAPRTTRSRARAPPQDGRRRPGSRGTRSVRAPAPTRNPDAAPEILGGG